MARAHATAALREARQEFERVPPQARRNHPQLWAKLLLATAPGDFEVHLEEILDGLRATPFALGMARVEEWTRARGLSAQARERLGRFIDELPDNLIDPMVRLARTEQRGLTALKAGDLTGAGAALSAMSRWAAFASFPGNHLALADAAADKGVLSEERAALLKVLLTREWRNWVRPGIEKRLAQGYRSPQPGGRA
jgi:hypothetical protein